VSISARTGVRPRELRHPDYGGSNNESDEDQNQVSCTANTLRCIRKFTGKNRKTISACTCVCLRPSELTNRAVLLRNDVALSESKSSKAMPLRKNSKEKNHRNTGFPSIVRMRHIEYEEGIHIEQQQNHKRFTGRTFSMNDQPSTQI
jgi:hypothetical protein